jgi:ATP adenylyltransferase
MAEPGSLCSAVRRASARALRVGVLAPIPTERHVLQDGGIPFIVRVVTSLEHKAEALRRQAAVGGNPFLPYDRDLFIADLSPTHVCLLNRFNVLEHHLLLITRAFEEQESLLTPADFAALAVCLAEIDGLAFYNAGPLAGASQRHKHLQLVSTPLGEGPERTPIDRALAGQAPALPFPHAFVGLDLLACGPPDAVAETLLARYRELLKEVFEDRPPGPYNLLATRDWMLLVPRARSDWQGIEVNALGFAGALLVRGPADLERVRRSGPLALLRQVAGESAG